jgi:hypothetical protein
VDGVEAFRLGERQVLAAQGQDFEAALFNEGDDVAGVARGIGVGVGFDDGECTFPVSDLELECGPGARAVSFRQRTTAWQAGGCVTFVPI